MSKYKIIKRTSSETDVGSTVTYDKNAVAPSIDDKSKTTVADMPAEKPVFNPFLDDEDTKASIFKSSSHNESAEDKAKKIYGAHISQPEDLFVPDEEADVSKDIREAFEKAENKSPEDIDNLGENDDYSEDDTAEKIYIDDDDIDDDEEPVSRPKKKKKIGKSFNEYTSYSQNEEFEELYRRNKKKAKSSLFFSFIFTLALLWLESKSLPHPKFLCAGSQGFLYIAVDLWLILMSSLCVLSNIASGVKALFKWRPSKYSILAIIYGIAILSDILIVFVDGRSNDVAMYSSIASLFGVFASLSKLADIKRTEAAFSVVSSEKQKYVAIAKDDTSEEYENFKNYINEDSNIFSLHPSKFVSEFLKTSQESTPYNEHYKVLIPVALCVSALFSGFLAHFFRLDSFVEIVKNFVIASSLLLPVSSFLSTSFPFLITELRLSRRECAILGEASLEKHATASVISFADSDVFNSKGISIKSIKPYGKSRIDLDFVYALKVFNLAGGPLKEVFNRSVSYESGIENNENDKLLAISENGLKAIIDDKMVHLGSAEYILASGFEFDRDFGDDKFEAANGRIMYMAIGDELLAKFYIKYTIGKNFKRMLDKFYNLGICITIKSSDPNIDTKFLTQILKDDNYPIVVIKRRDLDKDENETVFDEIPSGIISTKGIAPLLQTFLYCDKLKHLISLSNITKYVSMIVALIIALLMIVTGTTCDKITPLFIAAFQVLWTLPVIFTSVFQ